MSKGKRKKHRSGGGGGGRPAATAETILADLDRRLEEIEAADSSQAGPLWGAAHQLMLKTAAAPADVGSIIARRDLEAARRLLRVLRGEEAEATPAPPAESAAPADIAPETMKKALRAFRKRLKLVRLDHESRLGVGPMTGGKKADVDAIMPPREFDDEVWEALVSAGRLRRAGRGFYALPEGDSGE